MDTGWLVARIALKTMGDPMVAKVRNVSSVGRMRRLACNLGIARDYRLTRLAQSVLNSLRMSRDYREQNPRGTIGPRPSLLPVPQSGWLETKLRGECRLAQTEMPACFADIDGWHFHSGNADGDILAFDPVHGFLKAGDYPAATALLPNLGDILFLHSVILF
jgi:hypothetical protein